MTNQLESQLKRVNPQAYKEFQEMRKNGNPEEYLNKIIGNFTPEQKQGWNSIMGINAKR